MKLRLALLSVFIGVLFASLARPEPAVQAGKGPYDRVCSVCHGLEGRGDAGPGLGLVPFERECAGVLAIVGEGVGEMPPIAPERVSGEAVKQIVEYLKSLNAAPPPLAAALR